MSVPTAEPRWFVDGHLVGDLIAATSVTDSFLESVHQRLKASGLPVEGVYRSLIGGESEWSVVLAPNATAEDRANAMAILATIDPADLADEPVVVEPPQYAE